MCGGTYLVWQRLRVLLSRKTHWPHGVCWISRGRQGCLSGRCAHSTKQKPWQNVDILGKKQTMMRWWTSQQLSSSFSAFRVTLVAHWCATGSCTALSPGARAVLCLTTRVFTQKSAPWCPGLKTFWLAIAKLLSSSTKTALKVETRQKYSHERWCREKDGQIKQHDK